MNLRSTLYLALPAIVDILALAFVILWALQLVLNIHPASSAAPLFAHALFWAFPIATVYAIVVARKLDRTRNQTRFVTLSLASASVPWLLLVLIALAFRWET